MSSLQGAQLIKNVEISVCEPSVCVPLIGKTEQDIIREVNHIRYKRPDVVEWRADFFEYINDPRKVMNVLSKIRENMPNTLILVTIRSEKEGGQTTPLTDIEKVKILAKVCSSGLVNFIDYELNNKLENIKYLRLVSLKNKVKLIISYHNFEENPERTELMEICKRADVLGADIVKVAVMPNCYEDVLELLRATQELKDAINAELITISMGKYGVISRLFGWIFGSAMTFGIGVQSSAPGQIPIDDLRKVIEITKKYV